MIKFNSEKQDEMLFHLKLLNKEITNYTLHTKQEFTFVRDVLFEFDQISSEYKRKLENLIKDIRRKNEELILQKSQKLAFEQKTKYATILEFVFIEFENFFRKLKKNLDKDWPDGLSNLITSLTSHQDEELAHLSKLNKIISKDLLLVHKHRNAFRLKKEKYFDNVQDFKLNVLVNIQNKHQSSSPGKFIRVRQVARPRKTISGRIPYP